MQCNIYNIFCCEKSRVPISGGTLVLSVRYTITFFHMIQSICLAPHAESKYLLSVVVGVILFPTEYNNVSYQIFDFLEEHSFISMGQSANLKSNSTQTSLHRVIDDSFENVNDGTITGACLLDIWKSLDSINHTIPLKKLEMYGIISTELKWFSRYLRGRKQVVKFHQETSELCVITCGVTQGLVLGPLLFLLLINDISYFTVE